MKSFSYTHRLLCFFFLLPNKDTTNKSRRRIIQMDRVFITSPLLTTLTKFAIVSISLLSLFFSHDSYFARFTIRLVTHAIDKNYMFLFCNGLLVFVAKYSGLITSKPGEDSSETFDRTPNYEAFESYKDVSELEFTQRPEAEPFLAEGAIIETEEERELVSDKADVVGEPEKNIYVVHEDQNRVNACELNEEEEYVRIEFDGGMEEEENVGMMTAEEMNKKFDEFIRKMKEELRIEARRHLIVV